MAGKGLDLMDLAELQFIDNALSARFSEMEKLKNIPELGEAEIKLDESRAAYDILNNDLHEVELKSKKLEDSVEINEQKINSNKKKLFSGTINDSKELSNYQNEIDMLKKSSSRMEDEILELMEEQERLGNSKEILADKIDGLESAVKRINSETEEKREGLKHNIEGLRKRKDDVISRIPEDILKRYNNMKMKKGGIAVSIIKDNFCSVCNMEIPSVDSEKFVDSDVLYNCPICGRLSILYRPGIDDIKREFES